MPGKTVCVLIHSYPHMRCPLLSSDYQLSAVIDCDTAMDVDDGWVLSGVHSSPTPHASIISASLPLNGDYSPYIEACETLVPFNCEHINHTLKHKILQSTDAGLIFYLMCSQLLYDLLTLV